MPSIPAIKAIKLIKVLEKDGFVFKRSAGSHQIFFHPLKRVVVSIPVHKGKDLGKGITLAILKDAKISTEQFLK
ncbi:hypothetical protein A2188_03485 [Candidatus Woesebacteria bacterium RIFOXYA1_FULL_43_9]|uniref:Toxin HicA n=1 Tax=Candidatus Woesebacteria bacterium RIFOXYA1_FULL_43_9 TaxID=1802534 RepID=A0A1F8CKD2_9BACT|nr:MAG: hypothetical protein A2188_03485 [Candidatus Woesebacteria bacterium RIFOXYA1_FULL_43_9]